MRRLGAERESCKRGDDRVYTYSFKLVHEDSKPDRARAINKYENDKQLREWAIELGVA